MCQLIHLFIKRHMRLLSLLLCISLFSCWDKPRFFPDYPYGYQKVYGWKPVYGLAATYKKMTYSPSPQPVQTPGKIFVQGTTIYQNELNKGIHLIDNRNPANAQRMAFISLPGNTEMAVKGNYVYANNFDDIVVIDISQPIPVVVKRLAAMFSSNPGASGYPWLAPPESGFYDCPKSGNDSVVISWVRDSVYANCYNP